MSFILFSGLWLLEAVEGEEYISLLTLKRVYSGTSLDVIIDGWATRTLHVLNMYLVKLADKRTKYKNIARFPNPWLFVLLVN